MTNRTYVNPALLPLGFDADQSAETERAYASTDTRRAYAAALIRAAGTGRVITFCPYADVINVRNGGEHIDADSPELLIQHGAHLGGEVTEDDLEMLVDSDLSVLPDLCTLELISGTL